MVAASLVAVEGAVFVLLSLMELASLSSGRMTMALTTAVFFAGYGAGLVACAVAVRRGSSWARSPIVLAQLIHLLLAWSFRGGETTTYSIVLALVAVVVLVGLLHPASIDALSDDEG
ncbi:hypothetical protein GCM10027026_39060 [Myroides odoratimimus subsp. xuanwuensis]